MTVARVANGKSKTHKERQLFMRFWVKESQTVSGFLLYNLLSTSPLSLIAYIRHCKLQVFHRDHSNDERNSDETLSISQISARESILSIPQGAFREGS